MELTDKTIKALQILTVDYGSELTAGQFAQQMWPDSKAWRNVKNTGNGACSGKGMWLSAGSYLAKLSKRKLVDINIDEYQNKFKISHEGKKALEKYLHERQV